MEKKLCIAVYVFGSYTKYVPYYIYSILKSYPHYYVKIFCMDKLAKREAECLDLIRKNLSTNFMVKENYFPFPQFREQKLGRPLRFLIPYHEFSEFDYVYIGDVDFLIVQESPSLLDGHIEHCKKIKLPYSNQIRPNTKRLTGLHFFKVKEYYQAMNEVIDYYSNNLGEVYSLMKKYRSDDEKFLYKMIEKTIGFGKINDSVYRPHHGFHLGILRINAFESYIKGGYNNPFHRLPPYTLFKKQLLTYYEDPLFKRIININPITEILTLKKKLTFE
ncbi:MAG TPA: hypothetical protein GX525_07235 [Bacilli bacterium]|nr:hypothetical protein [Bacilli bacterium]